MTTRDTNKKTTTDENTRDTVNRENLKNQKIFKDSASNSHTHVTFQAWKI